MTTTPTRRERALARLERRREWAAGRRDKAAAAFGAARTLADSIPFGQPILVGHHSEKRARRDADRIGSNMDKGCECADMADHHESKARGIEQQLARTVFSDDPDAVESLQAKINAGRAQLAEWKAANAAWRKGGVAGLVKLGWPQEQAEAAGRTIAAAYSWEKQPYVKWQLTNLGANLRRMEERIKHIGVMNERKALAGMAEGGVVIEGDDWVRVTFAEKPERATLDALKAAGFRWGSGSWCGERAKLPACEALGLPEGTI